MNCNEVLKKHFGYDTFRSGQTELVESILSGKDTLGVMPTGAGKSICYQVPALMLRGITLVISPLISLMQDQVTALVQSGIRAAYINSSLSANQLYTVINNARNGVYKLIYVAPERLNTELFMDFAVNADISMITVDEAHCISQWGQDFRPSYLNIPVFAKSLPRRPIMTAFTATATERVRTDISQMLELNNPTTLVTGFDRKNLYFEVRHPSDKFADLKRLVKTYSLENRSGIIYCSTRKNVEKICEQLSSLDFSVTRYHAGLNDREKHDNQEDFIFDRKKIMVATNAFGMGIDKSNVTYIIHYNMPKDVESYYQEAGRAGRDGSPSDCILLYSGQDVNIAKFLINKSCEESELEPAAAEKVKSRDLKRLRDMTFYCTTAKCLRSYILQYFGEKASAECSNCSYCCSDEGLIDITVESQKILSCIFRGGQKLDRNMIIDVLIGASNERIIALGLDKLTTYAIMQETEPVRIRRIIDKLENLGYIEITPDNILKLCSSAIEILKGIETISVRMPRESTSADLRPIYSVDPKLMKILQALRAKTASVHGIPAYLVFSDTTLRDMCQKRPRTDKEFMQVTGVVTAKLERYGDMFMQAISDYLAQSKSQTAPSGSKQKRNKRQSYEICAEILGSISNVSAGLSSTTITNFTDKIISDTHIASTNVAVRKAITGWLESIGYIETRLDEYKHEYKFALEKANEIGIYNEPRTSAATGKSYIRVLYKQSAQQFILDNFAAITEFSKSL